MSATQAAVLQGGKDTTAKTAKVKVFSESECLSKYKNRFDYPQTAASSAGFAEDDLGGAWRYVDQWSFYRVVKKGSNKCLEPVRELPKDNNLKHYVLQGTLVAPPPRRPSKKKNGATTSSATTATTATTTSTTPQEPLKILVRIDQLSLLSLDRGKDTRGWWVANTTGDYYRLLEPDLTHLPMTAHLERRTLLALFSNVLDCCFSEPKQTRLRAEQDVYQVLEPYRRKMWEQYGVEVLPFIAVLRNDMYNFLHGIHNSLDDKSLFLITLKAMKPPFKKLDLMDVTIAAELMSNQQPWGLELPAPPPPPPPPPPSPVTTINEPAAEPEKPLLEWSVQKPASSIPTKVFNEAEILSEYQCAFDHPKLVSAEGYQIDDVQDEAPWRYVDQWSLYKIIKKRGLERVDQLPPNNNMKNYVLEGMLVGPPNQNENKSNGEEDKALRVRILLDKLSYVSFDRDKDTRGWWVLAHNGRGDEACVTAYYRLLEPDMSGLSENAHVERRALLAFLSGLLDTCFYGSETKRRAKMDVHEALEPYIQRMRAEGVDIFPFLVQFKDKICGYLDGSHDALNENCRFFKTLKRLQPLHSPIDLLQATAAAERVAGQKPWGLRLPATTTKQERRQSLDRPLPQHSKKPRIDSCYLEPCLVVSAPPPSSCLERCLAVSPPTPSDLKRLEDFKHVLREVVRRHGRTMEELEKSSQIRQGNNSNTGCEDMQQAQYGRILPDAVERLFGSELLDLGRRDCFVDIGHGIGTLVLQAAYTRGCKARGIELMPGRHEVAESYKNYAEEYIKNEFATIWGRTLLPGKVDFRLGELQAPENSDFLTNGSGGLIKAFCNNFAESMGSKAKKGKTHDGPSVDDFIAGLFASTPPGSVLITLHPLNLVADLDLANNYRREHGFDCSTDASFFSFEIIDIGPANQVATWSEGGSRTEPIRAYKYTRLEQRGRKSPVFLCQNYLGCQSAANATPLNAIKRDQGRALIDYCSCKFEPHKAKPRRTRCANGRYSHGA